MNILAVINHKGGVGKTTTTVSLAAAAAELGQRTLVLDLDPQGDSTRWLGVVDQASNPLPFHVLEGTARAEDAVVPTSIEGVSLLPSSNYLASAARYLATEPGSDFLLRGAMSSLAPDQFDLVLIDGPPAQGFLSHNALAAATALIVPVEARFLGAQALAQVIETSQKTRERLNPALAWGAIVITRSDRRTRHGPEVAERVAARIAEILPGIPVVRVREDVKLAEAAAAREGILSFAPKSRAAEDYRGLAAALAERLRWPVSQEANAVRRSA